MEMDGVSEVPLRTAVENKYVLRNQTELWHKCQAKGKSRHSDTTWTWRPCRDITSYILYFLFYSSLSDTFRGYSEQEEDDVNIPSRTLDSRAHSIGLTPPCSCGTCPQAFHTTACLSACLVLSNRASSLYTPPVTHPHHQWGAVWRTGPAAARSLSGSVWPPSNMFPAWRRERRIGRSTVAQRTMVTVGWIGQLGQMSVSCWMLLSATCILRAQAQGKMRNSDDFFCWLSVAAVVVGSDLRSAPERL